MQRDGLTLSEEPLTLRRSWDADGITVLTLDLALPRCGLNGRRARRFDRYYQSFLRAYLRYCEAELLPRAAESCRAAMARSAPWQQLRAVVRYCVRYQDTRLLSLTIDAHESGAGTLPLTLRRADNWERGTALLLPTACFFPPRCPWKRRLLRAAHEALLLRVRQGAALRGDWRAALRRSANWRNVYLDERGLCFFCPMYALLPGSEGIPVFTLPYDAEKGPFPPEAIRF